MYRQFMKSSNINFVSDALPHLLVETGIEDSQFSFWVCYGSFVLNQQTSESDVDLLFLHQALSRPTRVQAIYKDHPVTIYSLPFSEFVADGNQRRYGGYFSSKLLNPFVVFGGSSDQINAVAKVMGGFIGGFAATIAKEHGREIGTRDNVVADSILAYLQLCPFYRAYFLRYYISPNFSKIWDRMKVVIPDALIMARVTTMLAKDRFEYCSPFSSEQFHLQLVSCVARFWAFGSCCHGCNNSFPDYYFQKALGYIESNRLEEQCVEMLRFLEQKAG
jgi:hypothetical protein